MQRPSQPGTSDQRFDCTRIEAGIELRTEVRIEMIEQCLREARAAWPGITANPERFSHMLSQTLRPSESRDAEGLAPATVRSADLYLACACADGNPAAISALEEGCFPQVERALARLSLAPCTIEELKQQLRCQLFVGSSDKPPLITLYSGRGELRSWLRSVAVREGLHWLRRERRLLPMADHEALAGMTPDDPELLLMKATYGAAFRTAFAAAMATLSRRERNLLRQHFVDGLSIDKLGALYQVHRATAARWLVRAQESLLERTRTGLIEHLGVATGELDSIMRLLSSRLDQSIRGLLS